MMLKHNKLSFDHDDTITCQAASHHVWQLDFGSQFPSSAHINIPEKQTFLDGFEENIQTAAKRARQMDGDYPLFSSTSEGSSTSSKNSYIHLFPGYYEDHRKPVAIGPDHQADIPSWRPKRPENRRRGEGSDASTNESVGKIECRCLDGGSVRCARQHVKEAREGLRSELGHVRFTELGFCEMGEDVALGWTEEEEERFEEVVGSNPASFWDSLPRAFPSRSGVELVSYYFNVFMLRKRAEQNQWDLANADSDDDEWRQDCVGEDIVGDKLKCENGYDDDLNCGEFIDCDIFVGDCYRKPWDVSFIKGLDKELDLLPTCVIEEVFGSESWEKS